MNRLISYLKRPSTLILLAIFLLAAFLRLYRLGDVPFGLHEDEMMNGYVGRFILLNGKDLYANAWPLLYFDNFGDYPNVIPMYLSGIFTFLFGVNAFAIRFPIAIFGALFVFPMYALSKAIFKEEKYALLVAAAVAIMPWHIVLSRSTAENVTATFFYIVALLFAFRAQTKEKIPFIIAASLTFFLCYFLYPSYRILVPGTMFLFALTSKAQKLRVGFLIGFLFFTILTLGIGRTVWGQGRFRQTSIFYFNNTVGGRLQTMAIEEGQNQILRTRIFHNKGIGYTREFIRQYLSYFSPTFLFTDGGLPRRYIVEDSGLLYLGLLAVVLFAVVKQVTEPVAMESVVSKNGKTFLLLTILLLAASLLPAALTLDDAPNTHRAILMPVLLMVVVAYGAAILASWKKWGRFVLLGLGFFIALETVYFWHQWMIHGPSYQSVFRGDDRTALAHFLRENKDSFDHIYLPQDAKPLYYLFYSNNFSPELAGRFTENIKLSTVDNLTFIDNNCPSQIKELELTTRSLVIDRAECKQDAVAHPVQGVPGIYRKNETEAFRLYVPLPATGSAKIVAQ